jgi:hypothetical protein
MFQITIEATDLCSIPVPFEVSAVVSDVEPPNKVVLKAPSNFADLTRQMIKNSGVDMDELSPVLQKLLVLAYHHYALDQAMRTLITHHVRSEAKRLGAGEDEWKLLIGLVPQQ